MRKAIKRLMAKALPDYLKNKLYHPVKPLSSTLREKISRQCHRWLPTSVVQMLKKVRNTSSAQL
jgi:hypothetical protein